jgi:hypothetical protein
VIPRRLVPGASLLVALCCAVRASPAHADGCAWEAPRAVGALRSTELAEASGLAASRRRAGVLWAVNDSGNGAWLHALDARGADLGRTRLDGAKAVDWEDVASFELDGEAYLLVGDIGDNVALRPRYELYAVVEPAPGAATATPAWKVAFTYPDGARDGESVAVDAAGERILLLSKRDRPPRIHALPLRPPAGDAPVEASHVADFPQPATSAAGPTRLLAKLYGQPTAWDIGPPAIAVLTYARLEIYARAAGEPVLAALARPPARFELPQMAQAEALALGPDGTVYVTGEGRGAPLLAAPCARE